MADRDDEPLRDEDRHLLHVHAARLSDRGGVGDHEHVALVALHLGTLVIRQRVRERQPVQPELLAQLRHLALVRRVHIDPHQRVRLLQHVGDLRERQRVILAHALAVHTGGECHPQIFAPCGPFTCPQRAVKRARQAVSSNRVRRHQPADLRLRRVRRLRHLQPVVERPGRRPGLRLVLAESVLGEQLGDLTRTRQPPVVGIAQPLHPLPHLRPLRALVRQVVLHDDPPARRHHPHHLGQGGPHVGHVMEAVDDRDKLEARILERHLLGLAEHRLDALRRVLQQRPRRLQRHRPRHQRHQLRREQRRARGHVQRPIVRLRPAQLDERRPVLLLGRFHVPVRRPIEPALGHTRAPPPGLRRCRPPAPRPAYRPAA